MTERLVKWSAEARDFWESAPDDSVVLDIVISYACASQTGEGFEDLVNSINSEPIRRKIKQVVITDTSYLYRYCISEFAAYSHANAPTMWFLNNKPYIDKLTVDTVIRSWAEGIRSDRFKYYKEKILTDFEGNQDGGEIAREFRDLVLADSGVASYKNNHKLEDCIDFMLEECAYACAFLQEATLLYPMGLARCMQNAFKRYNVNVVHLAYKTSRYAQKLCKYPEDRFHALDREIATFMKEKVLNVNFFVIDKFGDHIYKNYALDNIIGSVNARRLTSESWSVTQKVMQTGRQIMAEENYDGKSYLSVKAPLMINDEVEGVIGLAVDVTDRKKAQELEILNKSQEKAKILAEQVAHDIRSPLIVLGKLAEGCPAISEKDHAMLRNAVTSIETIANDLLDRYAKNDEAAGRLR